MYLDFFGFTERPFSITPDLQYFYLGKQYEMALEALMYGINQRLGFVMLTGEVGTGKTLLSRALLARLDKSVATALLVNPLLSVPELLKAITRDFGIPVRTSSPQRLIEGLNRFLLKIAAEGRNALVVVDEAQNLPLEALEILRMLTNLETDKNKLLQIMLVGQPELLDKLATHELRQLDQRITARAHLTPLTQTEMMRYINHRICTAGGGGKVFFNPDVYASIHRQTNGYPRLVNILCDRTLMAAFVAGGYIVDSKALRAAIADWKGRSGARPMISPWRMVKQWLFPQRQEA